MPIISGIVFLGVGILMFYAWPPVQEGIAQLGNLVNKTGYAGTLIYGITERALIPFGLHHVFYMPFWQTELGGSMVIDGTLVQGAQNIFFAELASSATEQFSVAATRFMSGKFPFMIFGLPAAAYAIYRAARPEKRKVVGGLLLSAALTSFLTGITEPLEFTFLFVAPLMYVVHCILAGLSYMFMHILNVGVGMTFSGGFIDLTLFGILQGNEKTNWIRIVLVGLAYALVYYLVFYFMIKKFNYKTPGREADDEETKLYTRKDVNERAAKKSDGAKGEFDERSAMILKGLGGKENIKDIDCCATRLRVTVRDGGRVNDGMLRSSGASGVIRKGDGVQIIYGPQVSVVKSAFDDFLDSEEADRVDELLPNIDMNVTTEGNTAGKNDGNGGGRTALSLYAHMSGTVIPLSEVEDEAFSQKILGDGVAIEPSAGELRAPCDARVETVTDTGHAINLVTPDGCEILLHVGIDTVKLGRKFFDVKVKKGSDVKKGDLLMTFDTEKIRKEGYKLTTPMVVCNSDDYGEIKPTASGKVSVSDKILEIR